MKDSHRVSSGQLKLYTAKANMRKQSRVKLNHPLLKGSSNESNNGKNQQAITDVALSSKHT